jgi:ABC-type transport system substrate-binding protein
MSVKKLSVVLGVLVVVSMVLTACPAPQPQVVEKIVTQVVEKEVKVVETQVVEKQVEKVVTQQVEVVKEVAAEDFTTPHPILSDIKVRQAIAHCINRDELIASVYPFLTDEQKAELRMDTNLPKTHWAYKGPYTDYEYSVEKGGALLDEAGWKLAEGATYRTNEAGDTLALKFTTTTAAFRQTWAAVAEQNLLGCGIQMIRQHVPASWWFGDTTGLARRDFELGGYAWVGEPDPKGTTLYSCNQIPLPSNNWVGQNYMGWCNKTASDAIVAANNTLVRDERITAYDTFQKEFSKDMVSLPLFQRIEADAWSNKLEGIKTSPTEYATASAANWKMSDGSDTLVIGFSQEPASMFSLVESAAVQRQAAQLGIGFLYTAYDYDYQPALQDPLSTVESGLSKNDVVDVKAGDMVYDTSGKAVKLDKGVKVFDADGNQVEYDGSSPLKMKQLTSTYKFKDYTWSDGTKGSIADFELTYKIDCDRESGATTFEICDQIQKIDFGTGLEYTVTWLPGSQYSLYFLAPIGTSNGGDVYPSHQVVADGRKLADVPAKEWTTLPEIAEKPLSFGPYMLTEWKKGESMTFDVNPYYQPAPALKKIVIVIVPDTNQAVAQLLGGDIDYLDKSTLGAGPELQTVLEAAKAGKVKADISASPTWEHIDMNLFTK